MLAKDAGDRRAVAGRVLTYCHDFLHNVGADEDGDEIDMAMLAITDPEEVWRYVRPLHIDLVPASGSMLAIFSCDCDWETEHGLAIVYRDGTELIRFGPEGLEP